MALSIAGRYPWRSYNRLSERQQTVRCHPGAAAPQPPSPGIDAIITHISGHDDQSGHTDLLAGLETDPEKNPFLYPSEKKRMTLEKDIHMTDFIIPAEAPDLDELKAGKLDRFARLTVLSVMKKLKFGRIRIIEDHDQHLLVVTEPRNCRPAFASITRVFIVASCSAAVSARQRPIWKGSGRQTI